MNRKLERKEREEQGVGGKEKKRSRNLVERKREKSRKFTKRKRDEHAGGKKKT